MAFWSQTSLDPKRQFKFRVTFGRLGGSNATFLAQSADRPQFKVSDTAQVDFLDKKFYFPGKVTWEPVKIKFVDAVGGGANASKDSYDYLIQAGWIAPNTFNPNSPNYRTVSKETAGNQLGTVQVSVLNAAGGTVDTWTLNNAFITAVTLNNLDYAQEGILTAEYNFRFDWADYAGSPV